MKTSLDGSSSLAQQTLNLNNAEAARWLFLSLLPEVDNAPWNTAELRPLMPSEERAKPLVLTSDALPIGKTAVWMGSMYVEGVLKPAIAYRAS